MAEQRRVTIGFEGGQVLALKLPQEQLDELREALGGKGWHELQDADGAVVLDLDEVVYVRTDSDEHRVGF